MPGIWVVFTDKVLEELEPQPLFATTEIVPPLVPVVHVIEVEVELPDHPDGVVQV